VSSIGLNPEDFAYAEVQAIFRILKMLHQEPERLCASVPAAIGSELEAVSLSGFSDGLLSAQPADLGPAELREEVKELLGLCAR
jgi:hypothetical protein